MYYRKYRSQTIAEIDNSEIRETLGKSLLENKFSQAYLLIGTRGSGKTSMARLIAKVVNCTARKVGDEPCNKCDSCLAITDGRSLDVIEIDAASNTGVDDIRDLREKVKLAPVQGKFKIYIIDEVHMLSTSAFNALLKTLEEPPEHVIFVLATTDPQKLPETIVSRCLVYDFKTASKEELVRSLSRVVAGEKIKVEEGVLEKVADLGKGSFRDAQKVLEQLAMGTGEISLKIVAGAGSESSRDIAILVLGAVSDRDAKRTLEIVEKYFLGGGIVENLIEEMLRVVQEYL
jgi:DNA polymerase-3 subunit gamma/tau